jgi:hypothetical protein
MKGVFFWQAKGLHLLVVSAVSSSQGTRFDCDRLAQDSSEKKVSEKNCRIGKLGHERIICEKKKVRGIRKNKYHTRIRKSHKARETERKKRSNRR